MSRVWFLGSMTSISKIPGFNPSREIAFCVPEYISRIKVPFELRILTNKSSELLDWIQNLFLTGLGKRLTLSGLTFGIGALFMSILSNMIRPPPRLRITFSASIALEPTTKFALRTQPVPDLSRVSDREISISAWLFDSRMEKEVSSFSYPSQDCGTML